MIRACILLLSLVSCLLGQTWRGSISGQLKDANNAALANTSVRVVERATQRERTVTTSDDGSFQIAALAPGQYTVVIARPNLSPYEQSLTLLVNQDARLEIVLPAAQTQQVTVSAAHELLKTESPALSTVVDTTAVLQLPLDGRNFYELSLLAPGTASSAQGSAGSVRGDLAIHVNGNREDSNNFLLDGIYNGDPKLNGVGVTPPPDAIREFEVLTSNYDASFGRNSGGQINVVLQSGTNSFHGTVWEFLRNAKLDAKNHFAPANEPAPQYQQNQYGFAFGGPLVRNRTFFFGDYEGRRTNEGITQITNVPTGLERAGNFSQSFAQPIDLFTQQPFPGGIIPANRLHPVGTAIANLYPLPNRSTPGQNFISSPVRRDNTHHFDARLDHQFSDNSDFALRYSCADRGFFEPFTGPSFPRFPGFGSDVDRRAQNVMASETHAFTPGLLNEFRLGFNRIAFGVLQENRDTNLNQQVGLPQLWSNPRDQGLSLISLAGYSSIGDEYNNPQNSVTNTYQIVDQASYTTGRHLFKFGGEVRQLQQNAYRDVQARGFLSFLGVFTGNPISDLVQGLPTATGGARLDNHQNLRSRSFGLFAHDTFRMTPALVLSMGLRYEYTTPATDVRDRASLYDVATGGLLPVGEGAMPRSGYEPDRNNFAPRVGLAWTPGNGSTVFRAGYGIYYDQSSLAQSEGLYFNAPYYDFRLYVPIASLNYLISLSDPFPANYPFTLPSSATGFQRDIRTPYAQHWNANIQHEFGSSRVFEIGYVASKGSKLISARDINQPQASNAPSYSRPNPRFEDITFIESRGNSIYHSLQTKYQQRLTAGLAVLAAYTFGKAIDDGSNFFPSAGDPNFPQNSYDIRSERGRSNFDVRHKATVSYTYDLPFRGSRWVSGWQTNGFWTFQTGRPFTVALLQDLDNSNTGRSTLGFGSNDRPNVIRDPKLDDRTEQLWFDTSAFVIPARGNFGNAGRNIVEGPGLSTVNASLLKNTVLTEQVTLQLRAEAFNLLDRTNYNQPDNYVGSPSFGAILSAGSPRRLQFGVKILF